MTTPAPINTTAPPTLSHAFNSLAETWVDVTPWRWISSEHIATSTVRGHYHINLKQDINAKAPHKPLLHGTSLFCFLTFQMLASSLFLLKDPAFLAKHNLNLPDIPESELRRRLLFTSVNLNFSQLIFEEDVFVDTTITKIKSFYSSKKLVFLQFEFSVNGGGHLGSAKGCINYNDNLF